MWVCFAAFAERTLDEIGTSLSPACREEAKEFRSGCSQITRAAHSVAGGDLEALHLTFSCAGGKMMNVTLLEAVESGDLTMINLKPVAMLPKCAQGWIYRKIFRVIV